MVFLPCASWSGGADALSGGPAAPPVAARAALSGPLRTGRPVCRTARPVMSSATPARVPSPLWLDRVLRPPAGATHMHLGLFYKIGRFARVNYWDGLDWLRSSKPVALLTPLDTPDNKRKAFAELYP